MIPIKIHVSGPVVADAQRLWTTKKEATAALAALRTRGLNLDANIEIGRARTVFVGPARDGFRHGWVISWPDHHNGVMYLMTEPGAWLPGRLADASPCWCATPCPGGHFAPWRRTDLERRPAVFTHVTRTVPDVRNQSEGYRTKSSGACGRWVTSGDSIGLCVCGWRAYTSTRAEAQSAARVHREQVSTMLVGAR